MIDKEARNELAACLEQLVSGTMTNVAFDDRCEDWFHSEDGAVAEIATFGWGLSSSDTRVPYCLQGRDAVSEADRQTANHAIRFLQTEREYEWPRHVEGVTPYYGLWGPGFYLLIGIALMASALGQGGLASLFLGGLGFLAIVPTFRWLITNRKHVEEIQRFYESGDFPVWPFLRQADWEEAERQLAVLKPHENPELPPPP
jgi:hypothetical protein